MKYTIWIHSHIKRSVLSYICIRAICNTYYEIMEYFLSCRTLRKASFDDSRTIWYATYEKVTTLRPLLPALTKSLNNIWLGANILRSKSTFPMIKHAIYNIRTDELSTEDYGTIYELMWTVVRWPTVERLNSLVNVGHVLSAHRERHPD